MRLHKKRVFFREKCCFFYFSEFAEYNQQHYNGNNKSFYDREVYDHGQKNSYLYGRKDKCIIK